jgi:hypothetical protein
MKTYFDYTIFSEKDGELLRTHVNGISSSLGRSFKPGGASLTLGDHTLSRSLREVAPGMSIMTMYIPKGQLILPEAEEHMPL